MQRRIALLDDQTTELFAGGTVDALNRLVAGEWIVSAGDSQWFTHRIGHTYAISGALAIIAFLTGLFVGRPAMVKAGKLAQSAASDGASKERIAAEMATLQRRAGLATGIATIMLVISAAGMAIARYL